MEREDVKPCPFCASVNVAVAEGSTFRWRKMVCVDCDASCGEVRIPTTEPLWSEGEIFTAALSEWNNRPNRMVRVTVNNQQAYQTIGLLAEHMLDHRDPSSPGYNDCDDFLCQWCEDATALIAELQTQIKLPDTATEIK